MKQIVIHPGSAMAGAAIAAVAALALSSQGVARFEPIPCQPGTFQVQVAGIPAPHTMVRIQEGSPYTVPPGKLFVATGLGSTSSSGTDVAIEFDGVPVWFGSLTSNAQTTHAVPAGLVSGPGSTVSAAGISSTVLGYLANASQ